VSSLLLPWLHSPLELEQDKLQKGVPIMQRIKH
jgi:hypothetical protein